MLNKDSHGYPLKNLRIKKKPLNAAIITIQSY